MEDSSTSGSGSQDSGGKGKGPAATCTGKSPGDDANDAFNLFRTYLDVQLNDLKRDLSVHTNKFKELAKKPAFNRESNKIQFEFNSEIVEGLEVIISKSDDDEVSHTVNRQSKAQKQTFADRRQFPRGLVHR